MKDKYHELLWRLQAVLGSRESWCLAGLFYFYKNSAALCSFFSQLHLFSRRTRISFGALAMETRQWCGGCGWSRMTQSACRFEWIDHAPRTPVPFVFHWPAHSSYVIIVTCPFGSSVFIHWCIHWNLLTQAGQSNVISGFDNIVNLWISTLTNPGPRIVLRNATLHFQVHAPKLQRPTLLSSLILSHI